MPHITLERLLKIDYDYVVRRITDFIRTYVKDGGAKGAVVGLSGGVDSSVTATLLVKALGSSNVVGLIMPYKTTPPEDVSDAWSLARMLGIRAIQVDISALRDAFSKAIPFFDEGARVANGNVLARLRMIILYYFANLNNYMVAGTGDKSEILIGYFTKYGDGGVDFLPIGDLYKTQVRALAKYLGLPDNIAYKPSSPRLWEGQTAEGELGLRYEDIDVILHALVDLRMNVDEAAEATGKPIEVVKLVWDRVRSSEHKRKTPPIPRMSSRTVGLDWRMPLNYGGVP